jgi:hypothetical protein
MISFALPTRVVVAAAAPLHEAKTLEAHAWEFFGGGTREGRGGLMGRM